MDQWRVSGAGMPRYVVPTDHYAAVYAVGDVHGCHQTLMELEAHIVADAGAIDGPKLIIMLGDYVDRGPKSSAVLYHLMASPPPGFDRICLRGNHDDALLDYLNGDPAGDWVLDHGAAETMRSYGLEIADGAALRASDFALRQRFRESVPDSHRSFLDGLPSMVTLGADIFVHAGIRPGRPLLEQTDEDLLWIRQSFIDMGPGLPCRVFHGHTPMRQAYVSAERVSLDTHCYKTGRLTAARLVEGEVKLIERAGEIA